MLPASKDAPINVAGDVGLGFHGTIRINKIVDEGEKIGGITSPQEGLGGLFKSLHEHNIFVRIVEACRLLESPPDGIGICKFDVEVSMTDDLRHNTAGQLFLTPLPRYEGLDGSLLPVPQVPN